MCTEITQGPNPFYFIQLLTLNNRLKHLYFFLMILFPNNVDFFRETNYK